MGKIIVIKGADFSQNAVEYKSYNYTFVPKCTINSSLTLYAYATRANVFIPRSEASAPTQWSNTSTPDLANAWSMIEIPQGATGVSLSMTNTGYYYGLVLRDASGATLYDSGWEQGGNDVYVDLSSYANAVYLTSTFKIGSAGSASFTNETLNDVGWSIQWEF